VLFSDFAGFDKKAQNTKRKYQLNRDVCRFGGCLMVSLFASCDCACDCEEMHPLTQKDQPVPCLVCCVSGCFAIACPMLLDKSVFCRLSFDRCGRILISFIPRLTSI